ncbi:MAG: hypothetical protein HFI31_05415 [Lachnospiraceae bacterium]|nr:hypothetical protein [Lachnospiraceae bacterium]
MIRCSPFYRKPDLAGGKFLEALVQRQGSLTERRMPEQFTRQMSLHPKAMQSHAFRERA